VCWDSISGGESSKGSICGYGETVWYPEIAVQGNAGRFLARTERAWKEGGEKIEEKNDQ